MEELYTNAGDTCYRITAEGSEEVSTLNSQYEEADGHLLLRASHAANEGFNSLLVCSEDTDVFIMSLAFSNDIGASLFMKFVTRTRTKVIDITNVAASLGPEVRRGVVVMLSLDPYRIYRIWLLNQSEGILALTR